jgi:hypothetical protein
MNQRQERQMCDIYTLDIPEEETRCSCLTVTKKACKSAHAMRYDLSNGKVFLVCNVSKHRKQAVEQCKDGVTATVSKVIYKYKDGTNWKYEYKVVATDVTDQHDWDCPLVNNSINPRETKKQIAVKQKDNQTIIKETRDVIACLQNYINTHRRTLLQCSRMDMELNNALRHMRANTIYKPGVAWTKKIKEDTCAICHEKLANVNSMKLYECSHAFHNVCIKSWFDSNKGNKTCPCCRVPCDMDKYYIYSRYKNAT